MLVCFSKVGEDLNIEASETSLVTRTLHIGRTAYFCFTFEKPFFESYSIEYPVRCKLLLKSCLAVFKNIGKNVENCTISSKHSEGSILFTFNCKFGVKKIYKLDAEDVEPIQAVFRREDMLQYLVIQAQILQLSLNNFPLKLGEISIILDQELIKLKSFIEPKAEDNVMKKLPVTELALKVADFEHYEYNSKYPTTYTLSLKELKAVVSFCDLKQGQTISMWLHSEGRPVLLSVGVPRVYKADFVIATLQDSAENSQSQSATDRSTASSQSRTTPSSAMKTLSGATYTPSHTGQNDPSNFSPTPLTPMTVKPHSPPSSGSSLRSDSRKRSLSEDDDDMFLADLRNKKRKMDHSDGDVGDSAASDGDVPDSDEERS
eukprot:TRINITY_DN2699_c0_g1_i1.p2 TRINITY_DN2699_c0_g1~~TRINITY_DN2699_c0_g1_i1.p2  ORF type:complete len:397 (-),score=80.65 TRINITY_DN2699_c0_g1_i1:1373-2497(-)